MRHEQTYYHKTRSSGLSSGAAQSVAARQAPIAAGTGQAKPGRPRIGNRAVLNGLWYIWWTGCQWKAVHRDWFGVSSSVLHERFQTWQETGVWDKVFQTIVKFYRRERRIQWRWQAVDSRSVRGAAGRRETGQNLTDAPNWAPKSTFWSINGGRRWLSTLAAPISTTSGPSRIWCSILRHRVRVQSNISAVIKGYDYDDVRQLVNQAGDVGHIKRKRNAASQPPIRVRRPAKPSPARR